MSVNLLAPRSVLVHLLGNVERDLERGDEEERDGAMQLLAAQFRVRLVPRARITSTADHLRTREHRRPQTHRDDAVAPADEHPVREEQDEAARPALHVVQRVARRYTCACDDRLEPRIWGW